MENMVFSLITEVILNFLLKVTSVIMCLLGRMKAIKNNKAF